MHDGAVGGTIRTLQDGQQFGRRLPEPFFGAEVSAVRRGLV
jgi:hypothetical protein